MRPIASDYVSGTGEESFHNLIDEMTKKIKTDLRLSEEEIKGDTDREVGKITTSSPEAFKYYSEGRKCHLLGDFPKSISFMERVIEIDPEFAMAYRSLAVSYNNLRNFAKAFYMLGKIYEQLGDTDKAIEQYEKFFDLWKNSDPGLPEVEDAKKRLLALKS